eukprot:5616002-Pyramimonas_sp.AAC.2
MFSAIIPDVESGEWCAWVDTVCLPIVLWGRCHDVVLLSESQVGDVGAEVRESFELRAGEDGIAEGEE